MHFSSERIDQHVVTASIDPVELTRMLAETARTLLLRRGQQYDTTYAVRFEQTPSGMAAVVTLTADMQRPGYDWKPA